MNSPPEIHRRIAVNGIHLHCVERGSGPLVVLLHGFPEFWYAWRHQLPALAEAGFRCLAPDLRGYNLSDRPTEVSDYRAASLVEDIVQLIRQEDGSAFVVGHDWGGVLAWRVAALHPRQVRRLAVLNAPHPAAYRDELARNLGQWLRSWYFILFQVPGIAERFLQAGNLALPKRMWRRHPTRTSAFTEADLAVYAEALSGPGAVTGPLNYYRAAIRHPEDLHAPPHAIDMPTLVLWGDRDPYLDRRLCRRLRPYVADLQVVHFPQASHWLQHDEPQQVNRLLIDFFRSST